MEITYTLEEEDYVNLQLYLASAQGKFKKRIRNSRFDTFFPFLIFWGFMYDAGTWFMIGFLGLGLLLVLLLPIHLKRRYKKLYSDAARDHFQYMFGKESAVKLTEDYIEETMEGYHTKSSISYVKEIHQTGDYYFIILFTGQAFIFPKKKIANTAEFSEMIDTLTRNHKMAHHIDFGWKW